MIRWGLPPAYKIGNRDSQRERALEVLEWVGMHEDVLTRYPHEF